MDFNKPNLNGRKARLAQQKLGRRYNLVKLDIDGNKPANNSYVFTSRKRLVGTVTSALWSPSAKASIALASLQAPYGKPGEEFLVEIYYQKELKWSRVMATAHVISGVFYAPPRKRLTPPADYLMQRVLEGRPAISSTSSGNRYPGNRLRILRYIRWDSFAGKSKCAAPCTLSKRCR